MSDERLMDSVAKFLVHIIIISLPTFRTSQAQCRSWHTVAYEAPRRTPFSPDDHIVHDGDGDHDKKKLPVTILL